MGPIGSSSDAADTPELGRDHDVHRAPAPPRIDPAAVRARVTERRAEAGPAKGRGSRHWKRFHAQSSREVERLGREGYERELRRRLAYDLARQHGGSELEAWRFSYGHPPARPCVGGMCTGRHRRAAGAAAPRRRGSRRSNGTRAGPDADGDDGPGEVARSLRRRGEHGEAAQ